MNDDKINGYGLSRQWFEFAEENSEKIKPVHAALWFWLVELNNQLNWNECFCVPTDRAMAMIGTKSFNTYKSALDDLIRWGFVKRVAKSKNQHTSNVYSLVKIATSKNDGAELRQAGLLHQNLTPQNDIDKQYKQYKTIKHFMSGFFNPDFKPQNVFDSIAFRLWNQCYTNRIAKNIKPTILKKAKVKDWSNEVRLMINQDKRTEAEIIEVLEFLKSDSFWCKNIESTATLRKRFERLQLEMKTPKAKKSGIDLSKMDYTNPMSS
jgi:hypothetical protein